MLQYMHLGQSKLCRKGTQMQEVCTQHAEGKKKSTSWCHMKARNMNKHKYIWGKVYSSQ